jgi:hypothetical protein
VSFYYHWTTCKAWVTIQREGLKLSKPTTRFSPVGVPYDVQGGKIWLCDKAHIRSFAEHLRKLKGPEAAQVLLKVSLWDQTVKRFRPMAGAYFITYPIPAPFIQGSADDVINWVDETED